MHVCLPVRVLNLLPFSLTDILFKPVSLCGIWRLRAKHWKNKNNMVTHKVVDNEIFLLRHNGTRKYSKFNCIAAKQKQKYFLSVLVFGTKWKISLSLTLYLKLYTLSTQVGYLSSCLGHDSDYFSRVFVYNRNTSDLCEKTVDISRKLVGGSETLSLE